MITGQVVAGAIALCAIASTAQAQQQAAISCWQNHELQAARVRDLQTLLMVGALQCTTSSYDVAGHYNNFIRNSRNALAGYNDMLKARFMREQGISEGRRAYDSFATTLANGHSARAQATPAGFCQTVSALVGLASTASARDLEALAEGIAERPPGVGESCAIAAPPPNLAVVPVTAPVAPAAISAAPAEVAIATLPVPQPSVAPAAAPPISPPAPPLAVASADQSGGAPAPASPADALQAAALAVQAAAAALQAAATSKAEPAPTAQAAPAVAVPPINTVALQPEPIVPPIEAVQK